jgi:hypothetical protein
MIVSARPERNSGSTLFRNSHERAFRGARERLGPDKRLGLVDARRPPRRLGDGAWNELSPEAIKRQTVELYQAIEEERRESAGVAKRRRQFGHRWLANGGQRERLRR